jgi:hypothetical protein
MNEDEDENTGDKLRPGLALGSANTLRLTGVLLFCFYQHVTQMSFSRGAQETILFHSLLG